MTATTKCYSLEMPRIKFNSIFQNTTDNIILTYFFGIFKINSIHHILSKLKKVGTEKMSKTLFEAENYENKTCWSWKSLRCMHTTT